MKVYLQKPSYKKNYLPGDCVRMKLRVVNNQLLFFHIWRCILLRLNPSALLRLGLGGYWFQHPLSQMWVCLPAECAENVSWPWKSPLRGRGSLTMGFSCIYSITYRCYIVLLYLEFYRLASFKHISYLFYNKEKGKLILNNKVKTINIILLEMY